MSASAEGNGGIISSFAAAGSDLVALCEDINHLSSDPNAQKQALVDAYKFAVDASGLVVEIPETGTETGTEEVNCPRTRFPPVSAARVVASS